MKTLSVDTHTNLSETGDDEDSWTSEGMSREWLKYEDLSRNFKVERPECSNRLMEANEMTCLEKEKSVHDSCMWLETQAHAQIIMNLSNEKKLTH